MALSALNLYGEDKRATRSKPRRATKPRRRDKERRLDWKNKRNAVKALGKGVTGEF